MATFDDELLQAHLARASEELPGPDYYSVLRWIHQVLCPARYLEIGIRHGDSLRVALPGTRCVGIDPAPVVNYPLGSDTRIFAMTSTEFFETQNLEDIWGANSFSLAFLDGLHLFEQALLDFAHLECLATPESVVMIHDVLPLDAETSERTRRTDFYSGDVWKLAMCLHQHRPDLRIRTIRTRPTGLCVIGGFEFHSHRSIDMYEAYLAEYLPLQFSDFRSRLSDLPETVDNTPEAVALCLAEFAHSRAATGGACP
ncbi:MAG TPA: class I SAM-dependent methyltransferase [Terriglobales bacterium]|nr:class I SAM-dependent methyltransferase [Terriglobales bacterium]